MNKKGQITIFIIVGILIVISAALVIYLKEQEIIFRPKPPIVPDEAVPIKDFVEICIKNIGEDAANIIGTTGGYINIPEEIANNPMSYISISSLERGKIPYWYYEGEERVPPLNFIELEIENYVNENLKECILDLEPFQIQYNINETGELSTEVNIEEDRISIEVNYPIEISDKLGKKITSLDKFSADVNYRLKKVYELAVDIMEDENKNAKLEDITVDLLALDVDIPYSNFEFSCEKKRWDIADIKDKLKLLLRNDLPLIRIDKTKYRPVPENQPYILTHYIWDVSSKFYPNLRASISYDDSWPLHLYIRPNKGSYVQSNKQQGFDLASFLCMQMWKFTYDIIYPVTATITDDKSGYTFTFAFDVLIDHNDANRDAFAVSSFEFETNPEEGEYCGRKVNDITVYSYENVSGEFESHLEIDGVNLSFTCLKFTCPIGVTEFEGPVGVLTEKFPYCVWGILKGTKKGYKEEKMFIATDKPGEADIYLTPLKKIEDYKIVKHKLTYDGDVFSVSSREEELDEDEFATISIKRGEHTAFGSYPKDELIEMEFFAYDDFEYELEIYLTKDEDLVGGYLGKWTADWDELEDADEAVFHLVYMEDFKDEAEQFAFITGLGSYSLQVKEPEFQ